MLFAIMMGAMSVEEKGRFNELYEEYHALVYYVAYEILKDYDAAEEVEQETFCKVIQNFQLFAGGVCARSKNLIAVMAKNTAIDMWRKQKSENRRELYLLQNGMEEECGEETEYQSRSAEDVYMDQLEFDELALAVKTLSPKECRAVELRYYSHLHIKEIAKMMDISEGAVKKLLQRGLASLKKKLNVSGHSAI